MHGTLLPIHHLFVAVSPRAEHELAHLMVVREVTHAHAAEALQEHVRRPRDRAVATDDREHVDGVHALVVDTESYETTVILSPSHTGPTRLRPKKLESWASRG